MVLGCAVAAVGFALWAHELPDLSVGAQWSYIVLAGAGVGLVLSPANTDALNRVPSSRYGEATGITQTVRNFGSSLGLAVLGTHPDHPEPLEPRVDAWAPKGIPKAQADQIADCALPAAAGGSESPSPKTAAPRRSSSSPAIQHDFALSPRRPSSTRWPAVMAVAFVVALICDAGGKVESRSRSRARPVDAGCRWYVGLDARRRRLSLALATIALPSAAGADASAATDGDRPAPDRDLRAAIAMLREQQDPPCETTAEQYEPTSVDTVLGNPTVTLDAEGPDGELEDR